MSSKKLGDLDLYGLFELSIDASKSDVRKAYRKKALQCHPDKNPDNPKAAELFHQLSNALEVLLDDAARAAYDKLVRAKEAAKLRHKALDDKRKRFKEDLEAREKAHYSDAGKFKSEEEKLLAEIERLRKEGAKLVQEEINLVNQEVLKDLNLSAAEPEDGSQHRIKVEWKVDESEELYNQEVLERIFNKYGDIAALVVFPTKGQALVEFKQTSAAELAVKIELGLMKNPLKLKWADKNRRARKKTGLGGGDSLVNERDYESLVLRNMRQAEERRKLIEKMKQEDEVE